MRFDEFIKSPWPEGHRNKSLFNAVLMARENGWNESDIRARIGAHAMQQGLSQGEVGKTIDSAMRHILTPNPFKGSSHSPLAWDAVIGRDGRDVPAAIHPPAMLAGTTPVPGPAEDWDTGDVERFFRALYGQDKHLIISYVNTSFQDQDGKWLPTGKSCNLPAIDFVTQVRQAGSIDQAIKVHDKAGVWVRLNPLKSVTPANGKTVVDRDIAEYRHVLVEFDKVSIDKQWREITRLRLPCATVVHSGGKSLHFAVKIYAPTAEEYKKRVAYLYKVLEERGLKIDGSNKNPSRLSRLPGVFRGDDAQYLVATNIGCNSWGEWLEYLEALKNELPAIENLAEMMMDPPDLAEELIGGILRVGHKMLLSGQSKGGKTFTLIHLACCISSGTDWLGYPCRKGRVLYINLEVDRASFYHRIIKVGGKSGYDPLSLDAWTLRGHAEEMKVLAKHLISRVERCAYAAIVIDPIYKALMGDENSAKDTGLLCNQLDKIADRTGAAVIIARHFSKGSQALRSSIDRTSGSGVFGRDPDAIGTMTEFEDDSNPGTNAVELEWTLREFAKPPKKILEWAYPLHFINTALQGKISGASGRPNRVSPKAIFDAINQISGGNNFARLSDVSQHLSASEKSIRDCVKKMPNAKILKGHIYV